jgi:ATP-dependent Clp protease ATP-binding subunit ClpB
VRNGYDPTYGARPLKRAIQREIETPLAKKIIGGDIRDGETLLVDLAPDSSGFVFTPQADEESPSRAAHASQV